MLLQKEGRAKARDPLPRLLAQLSARAGGEVMVERAASRPWASALFQGRRHVIALTLAGPDAAERRAAFAEGIEEAEWSLSGHFVADIGIDRSEEHTSELQSLMRISYAVFCLKKKNQ